MQPGEGAAAPHPRWSRSAGRGSPIPATKDARRLQASCAPAAGRGPPPRFRGCLPGSWATTAGAHRRHHQEARSPPDTPVAREWRHGHTSSRDGLSGGAAPPGPPGRATRPGHVSLQLPTQPWQVARLKLPPDLGTCRRRNCPRIPHEHVPFRESRQGAR